MDNREETSGEKKNLAPKYVYMLRRPDPWTRAQKSKLFEQIYGNNIEEWREALQELKNVVHVYGLNNVATGISCTYYLLEAQEFYESHHWNVSETIMCFTLNSLISSFLLAAVRGHSNENQTFNSISAVANDLNIDPRIVLLRNNFAHANNASFDVFNLLHALKQGFNWVKRYYWEGELADDQEQKKFGKVLPKLPKVKESEEPDSLFDHQNGEETLDYLSPVAESLKKLKKQTNSFYEMFHVGNVSRDEKTALGIKIGQTFSENFKLHEKAHSKLFIKEVLMVHDINKESADKPCCHCKSCIPLKLLKQTAMILSHVQDNIIQIIIFSLIYMKTENEFLKVQWLSLLFTNILDSKRCLGHRLFKKHKLMTLLPWKKVLRTLLNNSSPWRTDMCLLVLEKCVDRKIFSSKTAEKFKQIAGTQQATKERVVKSCQG